MTALGSSAPMAIISWLQSRKVFFDNKITKIKTHNLVSRFQLHGLSIVSLLLYDFYVYRLSLGGFYLLSLFRGYLVSAVIGIDFEIWIKVVLYSSWLGGISKTAFVPSYERLFDDSITTGHECKSTIILCERGMLLLNF